MNEANIIIFDDSPKITEGIENNFRPEHNDGYSFKIIGSATDLDSAIELVDSSENGEVDVAIVDGNLSARSTDNKDGERIVGLLQDKFADIVTIGFSDSPRDFGASVMTHKVDGFKQLVDQVKNA